jgi:hypothetical protein
MDKYRNIIIAGKSYNYDALRRLMIRLLDEEIGNMPFEEYIKANNTEIVDDFIMRVENEPEPEGDGYYWNETDPNK